jgi:hypothetical protein
MMDSLKVRRASIVHVLLAFSATVAGYGASGSSDASDTQRLVQRISSEHPWCSTYPLQRAE